LQSIRDIDSSDSFVESDQVIGTAKRGIPIEGGVQIAGRIGVETGFLDISSNKHNEWWRKMTQSAVCLNSETKSVNGGQRWAIEFVAGRRLGVI
jgi:hypothetical protein